MTSKAQSVEEYMNELPEDRRLAMQHLRDHIKKNASSEFSERMSYGMIGYVIPHEIYPDGYHCDPKLPLPFMNIASQKNFIAFYHMGLYADKNLFDWFVAEYPKVCKSKLDMGKSCVRFKKIDDIPFDLMGKLVSKMSAQQWIACYEKLYKPKS
jgi:uncharacterized protein YdhG (YjbR/CyaY superfamily)